MTYYNQDLKYSVLRLPEVKQQTGLSRSAIYQRISEDSFPKSINLGGRAVGWLASDIQAWIKSRLADSRMEG
jgi:prophage regulatory protein